MSGLRTAFANVRSCVRWWEAIPLAIAVAMAIRSYRSDTHIVEPDTRVFMGAASIFPHGTIFGGSREPGWPALLSIPEAILGPETGARVMGVVAFVALVLVVQVAARRFWGRGWAVVAAVTIAASPFFAYMAVQGLREEASAAGVIVFGLLVVRGPTRRLDWLAVAAVAGVVAMIRLDTAILTVPVLVLALILAHVGWRTAALSAAVFAVLVGPYLIGNAVKYGDALNYPSTIGAIYYRNLEFHGQPGYVNERVYRKNNYAGGSTDWMHYLFVDHDVDEVARRAIEGPVASALGITRAVFFDVRSDPPPVAILTLAVLRSPTTLIPWLFTIGGAAGAVIMVRRRRWPFAMMLGLATIEHFHIVQLRGYGIRLEIVVFPLLLLANLELWHALLERMRTAVRTEAPA